MDLLLAVISLTFIVTSLMVAIRVERTLPSGPVELAEPDALTADGTPRVAA